MNKNNYTSGFKSPANSLRKLRIPVKMVFIIIGILSTIWFLIRVIPKPSRATYPCMRATAPWASAFVIYLVSLSGSVLSLKKFSIYLKNAKYAMAAGILVFGLVLGVISLSTNPANTKAALVEASSFTPNNPIGEAKGIFPGRVVWVWNPDVTNEDMTNEEGDYWFEDKNVDEDLMKKMLENGLMQLSGTNNISTAWDSIFHHFNREHDKGNIGYTAGEKIMVKINLTNSCCNMSGTTKIGDKQRMDATPQLCLLILEQLIEVVGIAESDITFGDTYRTFRDNYWDKCHSVYPNVNYCDGQGINGRTQTVATLERRIHFSNGDTTSQLPVAYIEAEYFINVPCLKTHNEGGITIAAKNHQGSVLEPIHTPSQQSAYYMHPYLPANDQGNGKYRHLVDYMGHEDLGGNTLLYLVDGIWSGRNWEGHIDKWNMEPFNNDYTSSLFLSLDAVAIESVCFDFLLEEYKNKDASIQYPYIDGVEDYMLQAADKSYWPDGISYDPEGDGSEIGSLGVYEHWNNATDKQYSRNLGTGDGIELIKAFPEDKEFNTENSGLLSDKINVIFVDSFNVKWIGTDMGISRYDGENWDTINTGNYLRNNNVRDLAYEKTAYGHEFWAATDGGLSVMNFDVDGVSSATTYYVGMPSEDYIINDTILAVGVDIKHNRWIGTPEGLSMFKSSSWDSVKTFEDGYDSIRYFVDFPITDIESYEKDSMAYIATMGAGVVRLSYDEIDGFSGATTFDTWWSGLTNNNINDLSISDTIQWYVTDNGAYRHTGPETKAWWMYYNTEDGLLSDNVLSVFIDSKQNVWLGTNSGLSIVTEHGWYGYTTEHGLIDTVINTICEDMDGNIWIGTNKGVQYFEDIPGVQLNLIAPSLVSPEDGSSNVTIPVSLIWQGVIGAESYHIQVSTTNNFNSPLIDVDDITELSYAPDGLSGLTTYYWKVEAVASDMENKWSSVFSFTTEEVSSIEEDRTPLNNLSIFPNPATDHISIKFNELQDKQIVISIYDLRGSEIYREVRIINNNPAILLLNLKSMRIHNGVYFVNIVANNMNITKRILVR